MKVLNLLQSNVDVVLGVVVGILAAPAVKAQAVKLVGSVGGRWSALVADVGIIILGLLLLGRLWPRAAVAFASVFIVHGIKEGMDLVKVNGT